MTRTDRHNEIEINYLPDGSLDYLYGGKKIHVAGGRMAVFWAALPHQVVSTSGDLDEYYVTTIPLVQFLEWGLPVEMTQALLRGEFLCEADEQLKAQPSPSEKSRAQDLQRFDCWCTDFASNDPARLRAARLEIHARLERFAIAFASPGTTTLKADVLHKVELTKAEQMAAYIAVQYAHPISVSDVSQTVGLHPNHAMSVFSKTFGLSMMEFVRQHRLAQAQSMLVSTNDSILNIGFAAGFQSVSQFYAVFKHYCRCTPREYRAQYRS